MPVGQKFFDHVLVLFAVQTAGGINQPSSRSDQSRGGSKQRTLLARMLDEIAFLQSPFHVHSMSHYARVRTGQVQQDGHESL